MAKRKAAWLGESDDIKENVRKQRRYEDREYNPQGPLTNRTVLMQEEGKPVGQQSQFSRYAHVDPQFRGLDPTTTPNINALARFNIRGRVDKPRNARDVLVSDGAELVWDDDDVNPSIDFAMNALPVHGGQQMTWRAVGMHQYLWAYKPSRTHMQSMAGVPHTVNDAKFASVGVLNNILSLGCEKDAKMQLYSAGRRNNLPDFGKFGLRDWQPYGAVKIVEPIADGHLKGMPLLTFRLGGYAKVMNYWAACTPQVVHGAHCWWLYVRRPRDTRLASTYRDNIRAIREIQFSGESGPDARKKLYHAHAQNAELDWNIGSAANAGDQLDKAFIYQWEPWIELSPAHPDPVWYTYTDGAVGHAHRAGVVVDGCNKLEEPGHYTKLVSEVCFPDPDNWDAYDTAVSIDSKTGPRYALDPIGLSLDWRTF